MTVLLPPVLVFSSRVRCAGVQPGLVKYFFLDRRIIDQLNSNHSNNNKPSARSKQRRKK